MQPRKPLLLAATTVMLGSGLAMAAPAAQAQPTQASPTASTSSVVTGSVVTGEERAAKARWHKIWGPVKHKPTKYWATPDFVPRSKTLGVNARCWNGGDGTKLRIDIVRTQGKKVIKKGGWGYCTGGWMTVKTNKAKSGTAYYMRIHLKGKAHTIEAKAYYWK